MKKQRQHIRYQVEFAATFAADHAGIGIIYNLGMGGCKVVSDLAVKRGAPSQCSSRFRNRLPASPFKLPESSGPWNSSSGWNFLRCRSWNEPAWTSFWQPK